MRLDFDYSLNDAEVESVTIGPRREVHLTLALGSARISDQRLPDAATLRFGAIDNFEQVREFFVPLRTRANRTDRLSDRGIKNWLDVYHYS